ARPHPAPPAPAPPPPAPTQPAHPPPPPREDQRPPYPQPGGAAERPRGELGDAVGQNPSPKVERQTPRAVERREGAQPKPVGEQQQSGGGRPRRPRRTGQQAALAGVREDKQQK